MYFFILNEVFSNSNENNKNTFVALPFAFVFDFSNCAIFGMFVYQINELIIYPVMNYVQFTHFAHSTFFTVCRLAF